MKPNKIIKIKYGELNLKLEGEWLSRHECYECCKVTHQGFEIPFDMMNDDTLSYFDSELNEAPDERI